MAQWMDRSTLGFTQMGGEGANWIGEAPFSKRAHVFQNLGDGTYNHSGYLAIRAAIAAGVNITYKILFNDAVAMTGGQANDGGLTVPQIARQVAAEGAKRVVVVTDEPWKYAAGTRLAARACTIHHRDELQPVQKELARSARACTVLIYDQTCAAEKRRRRKRGQFPDPDKRVVINELVCEGCGDCGVKSNCVSVQPLETEFGRKRTIDQSSCNKDYSCVKGFCPSFVTVEGAKLKRGKGVALPRRRHAALPEPVLPPIRQTYGIIVTGIGGTGIVTIGAILGMAAHLEGKGVGVIDMAGLAQKGGAVYSHIRIAQRPEDIHAIRVAARGADLVLGGDIVVAGNKKVLAAVKPGRPPWWSTSPRSCPAISPATRIFRCRPSGSSAPSRADAGPRADAFRRRHARGHRAARPDHRRQHVHARLCLSARRAAALGRGDRAGDRAERRGGRHEQGGVPLGPPRRRRSPAALEAVVKPAPETASDARTLSQSFDEMVARARRLPHRLSERRLCGALSRLGRRARAAEARARPASAVWPKRSRAISSS